MFQKKLTITQTNDHPNFLIVGFRFSIHGEAKAAFDKKSETEKHRFWQDLVAKLYQSNRHVEFDETEGMITIEKWLPITKDLTEGMFYDAIEEVHGGVFIAITAFNQFAPLDSEVPLQQP